MHAREVTSNQTTQHKNLTAVVNKHLEHAWQKPISQHSLDAFEKISLWLASTNREFILDSGCGIGESSVNLALRFPNAYVLGFDRSEVRLEKLTRITDMPDNCMVIRADADDLWRQLASANLFPTRHFLFYPNPYPKAAQLNQRWHGSPAFPHLLAIGGRIELRSNWRIYLEEFQQAVAIATGKPSTIEEYNCEIAISAFERKYEAAGQTLWRLTANMDT